VVIESKEGLKNARAIAAVEGKGCGPQLSSSLSCGVARCTPQGFAVESIGGRSRRPESLFPAS